MINKKYIMLKVGLTGGIGSGKSTVAAIFETLGVPVYYADKEAKRLMIEDEGLIQSIKNLLGEESYINGILNREYIAAIVFNDPKKLEQLNQLIHPLTVSDSLNWMSQQTTPYAIKEAALIFESHSESHLNVNIGVTSPESLRIKRIMERDGIDEVAVRQRMSRQMSEEEKMKRCDFVIKNDESILLTPQVIRIHEKLIKMAADKSILA
jgi:dephospho-CoA kinase